MDILIDQCAGLARTIARQREPEDNLWPEAVKLPQ